MGKGRAERPEVAARAGGAASRRATSFGEEAKPMTDFHRTAINDDNFIRGAARLLWAGTTVTFPTSIADIVNLSTYDAANAWHDLGATKTGITITVNNTEETFDVDQVYGDLDSRP